MAQLPPDSQRATWSHSASPAALAWPASARPLPPRTAPVKAILATVTAVVLGLRCRPLMSARRPLCADGLIRCRWWCRNDVAARNHSVAPDREEQRGVRNGLSGFLGVGAVIESNEHDVGRCYRWPDGE